MRRPSGCGHALRADYHGNGRVLHDENGHVPRHGCAHERLPEDDTLLAEAAADTSVVVVAAAAAAEEPEVALEDAAIPHTCAAALPTAVARTLQRVA